MISNEWNVITSKKIPFSPFNFHTVVRKEVAAVALCTLRLLQGVNSIDMKNLGEVFWQYFGPKLGPKLGPILVLDF